MKSLNKKYLDTDEQALDRVTSHIKNWKDFQDKLPEIVAEAKERKLWKLKYDSWTDYCIIECGITRQWAHKLLNRELLLLENTQNPKRNSRKIRETDVNSVDVSESKTIDINPAESSPELAQPLNPPKSEPLPTKISL